MDVNIALEIFLYERSDTNLVNYIKKMAWKDLLSK